MPQILQSTPSSSGKNYRVVAGAIALCSAGLLSTVYREEGVRYEPYYDTVGVKSVCVGSTEHVENRRYTPLECNSRAARAITGIGGEALSCIHVPIAQSEYEAYAEFAYNIGSRAFCSSTLVRKLNQGDYAGACKEVLRWTKQPELRARRQRTYVKCTTPIDTIKEEPNVVVSQITIPVDLGPIALKPARNFWKWFVGRS